MKCAILSCQASLHLQWRAFDNIWKSSHYTIDKNSKQEWAQNLNLSSTLSQCFKTSPKDKNIFVGLELALNHLSTLVTAMCHRAKMPMFSHWCVLNLLSPSIEINSNSLFPLCKCTLISLLWISWLFTNVPAYFKLKLTPPQQTSNLVIYSTKLSSFCLF